MKLIGTYALIAMLALTVSCSKKDDDDDDSSDSTEDVAGGGGQTTPAAAATPGAIMGTFAKAMGSSMTSGSSDDFALADVSPSDFCTSEGQLKDAYQNQESSARLRWLCDLSITTNGPDTSRGAVGRVAGMLCALDSALADGITYDGQTRAVSLPIATPCFTQSFVDMVLEQGLSTFDIDFTAHATVPAAMGDATKWNTALEMQFDEVLDNKKYTVLFNQTDGAVAASVLDDPGTDDSEEAGIFAFAMTYAGDKATLRYEGRFPEGSESSRHVRLMVAGDYTGLGGFSALDSGSGASADYCNIGSDYCSDTESERIADVRIFVKNSDGFYGKEYHGPLGSVEETQSSWTGSGAAPTSMDFGDTAADHVFLISDDIGGYTKSAAWHAANGALDFTTVTFTD